MLEVGKVGDKFNNYYGGKYCANHYKGILGFFTTNYHRLLEIHHSRDANFKSVLEIGGGTGEHLAHVRHHFDTYMIIDISEIAEKNLVIPPSIPSDKVHFILADASEMPFEDNCFDRVLGTCVLHHIPNLELAVLESRRVAKDGAYIDFYVPCDPGMIYRWARHWTSHFKQKKLMKLSWSEVKYLWATEHRNHYLGVIFTVREIFKDDEVEVRSFPFRFLSWNLNLFTVLRIKVLKP